MSSITPAAIEATLECLRVLAAAGDLGPYTAFVGHQATRESLTPGQATSLRKILVRHADHLPADLLAAALTDEPPPPPPMRRGPGRPRIGAEALSPAERTRRRRAAAPVVAVELPADVAERLRRIRDAEGVSTAALVTAALDALEAA